jgi:hypothetical protein
MSQTLIVELSDAVFRTIESCAQAKGATPAEVAAHSLEQQFAGSQAPSADCRPESERQTAQIAFEALIGAADRGRPLGIENDSIDRELAREYGNRLEPD